SPELGPPAILATIDETPYTITEDSVRSQLQLADDGGIDDLPIAEIYSGMDNLGYVTEGKLTFYKNKFSPQWRFLVHTILHCLSTKSGSWDQFGSLIVVALICLSDGRKFNWSSYISKGMLKDTIEAVLDVGGNVAMVCLLLLVFPNKGKIFNGRRKTLLSRKDTIEMERSHRSGKEAQRGLHDEEQGSSEQTMSELNRGDNQEVLASAMYYTVRLDWMSTSRMAAFDQEGRNMLLWKVLFNDAILKESLKRCSKMALANISVSRGPLVGLKEESWFFTQEVFWHQGGRLFGRNCLTKAPNAILKEMDLDAGDLQVLMDSQEGDVCMMYLILFSVEVYGNGVLKHKLEIDKDVVGNDMTTAEQLIRLIKNQNWSLTHAMLSFVESENLVINSPVRLNALCDWDTTRIG
ncbi:hypothetical protein Tco_0429446, partial [Tanacetum coccineum]